MENELINHHIKKAEGKLSAAKIEFDDKLYDEVVGTAYYAMYHAARALLLTKEISPKTHKGIIIMLGKEFLEGGLLDPDDVKKVSWGLERRIRADYDPLMDMDRVEASEALHKAEEFIGKIKDVIEMISRSTK